MPVVLRSATLLVVLVTACSSTSQPPSVAPETATAPATASSASLPSPTETRYTLTGRVFTFDFCTDILQIGSEDITVRDASGTIIALGPVGERIGSSQAWEFEVEDVPASEFYVVQVGDLVERTYSLEDLIADDWEIMLGVEFPQCRT